MRKQNDDFHLVQVYVDDITFDSTNVSLCEKFSKLMQVQFEMSMMGELTFYLDLQIKQGDKSICLTKKNTLKKL